jgi:hypothetical protein
VPNYQAAATRAAKRYGLDPAIFKAMIRQESGFREGITSGAGARDIAQFEPATAKAYGVTLGDNRVSDDLDGAARYLKANLDKYGSYHAALSVYNSGKPDAYKDPSFAGGQTYNYVRSILGAAKKSGGTVSSPSYRTIPGIDNSATRQQLTANYFATSHSPDALLMFKAGMDQAQDTPSRRVPVGDIASTAKAAGIGGPLKELFWNGSGAINVKNGKRVPKGFVEGHTDHVHVAGGPKSVVVLGKLAEHMGLHVGENPHFGGVHPVHVADSYHYKGEAVDVSGPPALMRRFAHTVARLYGIT